jgi:hypothetical protein
MKKDPDWSFLCFFASLLLTVCAVAKINAWRASYLIAEYEAKEVVVRVEGAVRKAGDFRVAPGTALADVIKRAKPLKKADLQKLPLEMRVEEAMLVVVEEKKQERKKKGLEKN